MGKLMIGGMNGGHAKLADWGISHLRDCMPDSIVELGSGGGRNAKALLKRWPDAKLVAVDYSALSVEKTKEYNKELIAPVAARYCKATSQSFRLRTKRSILPRPLKPSTSGRGSKPALRRSAAF